MSKRTRFLAFVFAVAAFVILSYVMVVYSLGYRYDLVHKRFLPTGSLRMVANVSGEVYINEELVGKTSFLGNSFSKSRLLPRTYAVRLERPGYQSWQKNIPISGGLFTDFPKIVLVPEVLVEELIGSSSFDEFSSVSFDVVAKTVVVQKENKFEIIDLKTGDIASSSVKALPTPKKNSIAKSTVSPTPQVIFATRTNKERTVEFNDRELWVTWLRDTDYQPFRKAGYREMIARIPAKIQDVQWHKDRDHLFVSSSGILSLMEIDKRGGINSFPIASLEGPFWYDEDENAVYYFHKNNLIRTKLEF